MNNETKIGIKPSNKEKPKIGRIGFTVEFYQNFKELTPMLFKLLHKIQKEAMLSNSLYEFSNIRYKNRKGHTQKENYRTISLKM
jgi:hypothetical protein